MPISKLSQLLRPAHAAEREVHPCLESKDWHFLNLGNAVEARWDLVFFGNCRTPKSKQEISIHLVHGQHFKATSSFSSQKQALTASSLSQWI